MREFLTALAWILGIPFTLVFVAKIWGGIKEGRQLSYTGQFFIFAAICWAWIISQC